MNQMNSDKHKRRGGFLIWLAVLLVLTVAVLALPSFHLGSFEVAPADVLTEEEIIAASGLSVGQHLARGLGGSLQHIFQLRYKNAEDTIAAYSPFVKAADVRMKFPGTVAISIEERIEVAYVNIPDGCVLIDKEGYALSIHPKIPDDIPVIEGIRAVSLSLGQPLTVDVASSMQLAVTIMGAIIDADRDERTSVSLMSHVRKIRPAGGSLVYLTVVLPDTGEELIILAERGGDLSEDVLWLRFALEQGVLSGHGKGILDLTGTKKIFRPDS
ncbi:MAG: FtsQ-type POTRA domain-containing protein [Clostridiaceae bacterium]|nr:FtsQ-type POTRA domain-containing protein [Clostridiaceae bacterium]